MVLSCVGITVGLSLFVPGCKAGYLLRSSYFQVELLLSRQPVSQLSESTVSSDSGRRALADFRDVKAFGAEIGLRSSDNYDTIAFGWTRGLWNITASEPLALEAKEWWFPIVGSVPYLGYFREDDVLAARERLAADGYDVYVRDVGAYSTLGWFRDPILPWMLEWSTYRIAQTTLHELAHATVWIPGSVRFNESFASFVGREAALRYLAHRYGPDGEETRLAHETIADTHTLTELLHGVYLELEQLYARTDLTPDRMLEEKERIFASIPHRVAETQFHHREGILRAVARGAWNNARLLLFENYNHAQAEFRQILDDEDGDLLRFMLAIEERTRGVDDPFEAIGVPPPE